MGKNSNKNIKDLNGKKKLKEGGEEFINEINEPEMEPEIEPDSKDLNEQIILNDFLDYEEEKEIIENESEMNEMNHLDRISQRNIPEFVTRRNNLSRLETEELPLYLTPRQENKRKINNNKEGNHRESSMRRRKRIEQDLSEDIYEEEEQIINMMRQYTYERESEIGTLKIEEKAYKNTIIRKRKKVNGKNTKKAQHQKSEQDTSYLFQKAEDQPRVDASLSLEVRKVMQGKNELAEEFEIREEQLKNEEEEQGKFEKLNNEKISSAEKTEQLQRRFLQNFFLDIQFRNYGLKLPEPLKKIIALSRIILQKPKIIFLDHNSLLLTRNSNSFNNYFQILSQVLSETTLVVIGNGNLQNIFQFDQLVFVKNGEVVLKENPIKIYKDNRDMLYNAFGDPEKGQKNKLEMVFNKRLHEIELDFQISSEKEKVNEKDYVLGMKYLEMEYMDEKGDLSERREITLDKLDKGLPDFSTRGLRKI